MVQLHVLFMQINTYLSEPLGSDGQQCLILNIHERTERWDSYPTGIYGSNLTSQYRHNGLRNQNIIALQGWKFNLRFEYVLINGFCLGDEFTWTA